VGAALAQALELRGLSKRFGTLQAVDDLSFEVRPDEVFGFVGSNARSRAHVRRR
jgi:ABC-2 type transport system ATP-binding protein